MDREGGRGKEGGGRREEAGGGRRRREEGGGVRGKEEGEVYKEKLAINQLQWSTSDPNWIAIAFGTNLQIM
jgi:hypothetical protein